MRGSSHVNATGDRPLWSQKRSALPAMPSPIGSSLVMPLQIVEADPTKVLLYSHLVDGVGSRACGWSHTAGLQPLHIVDVPARIELL